MQVGDLVKFRYVYSGCSLNYKEVVYLGKDYIHRSDGVVVPNHKVLEIGVEGDKIIDFQTGDMSQKQILEMYNES